MNYSPITAEVLSYIKKRYQIEPEYLWANSTSCAALRHRDTKKWFALLAVDMPKQTIGIAEEGKTDILNVKCSPVMIGSLRDGRRILPAYHMNKEHWITMVLDGSLPVSEMQPLIDLSYSMTMRK